MKITSKREVYSSFTFVKPVCVSCDLNINMVEMKFLFSLLLQERGEDSQPMREEELISLIDDVLRDDDKNNDGYIDYAEFAKSLE